jgi:putative ABC transport system permease protein
MRLHLELKEREKLSEGLTRSEAQWAARREFGNSLILREESREMWAIRAIETIGQGMKYGMRTLRKNPGFSATAVLTIALGIGATTTIFSLVYGVALRPLPYTEPERLAAIASYSQQPRSGNAQVGVGAANYRDWRAQNSVFEDLAMIGPANNLNLTGTGEPERLQGARVTASLFSVLRVSPMLGRVFTAEEEQVGKEFVAVLGYALWQRQFGGDPNVVGKTILLNNLPHTVIGVMKQGFQYPNREFDLWKPLTVNPNDYRTRQAFSFTGIGRLKTGVSIEQAEGQMNQISARLGEQYPASNKDLGVRLTPLRQEMTEVARKPLFLLLGAVGCLLLIAAANLVNLFSVRALGSSRDLAVRASLGATRGRLILESVFGMLPLLLLGGALGVVLSFWGLQLLLGLTPANLPRLNEIEINAPVLLFSIGVLAFIGLAIGVLPALQARTIDLIPALKADARAGGGRRSMMVRNAIVGAEMALTIVLLVGAGLLMRSFLNVRAIHPGFDTEQVLSLRLAIPRAKYGDDQQIAAYGGRLVDRVKSVPGVEAVGMVNRLPIGGASVAAMEFEGAAPPLDRLEAVDMTCVTPDYFRAMGIPQRDGRSFEDRDRSGSPLVAVIDERLAQTIWPGQNPIGRRLKESGTSPWLEIVGVVGHIRNDNLEVDLRPQVYTAYLQVTRDRMAMVVRTKGDPKSLAPSVIAAIRNADAEQPVYAVATLREVIDQSLAVRRLNGTLLFLFAVASLLLAGVGLYGVISYSVGERIPEFGVRAALGATVPDIVRLVLAQGLRIALTGAFLGFLASFALTRTIAGMLFNVTAFDPPTLIGVTFTLLLISLLACLAPARRAARIDPIQALRRD